MLKPQDLFILLKLASSKESFESFPKLAAELGLSTAETYRGLERSAKSRLYDPERRRPLRKPLAEFVLHGAAYVYPAHPGPQTIGLPTGVAATSLREEFGPTDALIPVWPDTIGSEDAGLVTGYAIEPLYQSAPEAARRDRVFYELLALLDAVREGRARERRLAVNALRRRLSR